MKKFLAALLLTVGFVGYGATATAYDLQCTTDNPDDCQVINQDGLSDGNGQVRNIINTLMYILAAIAVIVIIYGGFTYVTSQGDAGKVKAAKNTILYAVIGLIVALLAYGIVQFVVTRFS